MAGLRDHHFSMWTLASQVWRRWGDSERAGPLRDHHRETSQGWKTEADWDRSGRCFREYVDPDFWGHLQVNQTSKSLLTLLEQCKICPQRCYFQNLHLYSKPLKYICTCSCTHWVITYLFCYSSHVQGVYTDRSHVWCRNWCLCLSYPLWRLGRHRRAQTGQIWEQQEQIWERTGI